MISFNHTPALRELDCEAALPLIRQVRPELADVIEAISPDKGYTFIQVAYPWGQPILREERLYLPNASNLFRAIDDPSITPALYDKLFYNRSLPLGLALNKTADIHFDTAQHRIPVDLITSGKLFGLYPTLHVDAQTPQHWRHHMTAGNISLALLPKISNTLSYKRLKKAFRLSGELPKTQADQYRLFTELAVHPAHQHTWAFQVLYFTDKWMNTRQDNAFALFWNYLFRCAWDQSQFFRNRAVLDVLFSCAMIDQNIKTNIHLANTAKHIQNIHYGYYPAFSIACTDEYAPISTLQEIFLDIYQLHYIPTFIHTRLLSEQSGDTVYYAMELPTLPDFSPRLRKPRNKLDELREIKQIIKRTHTHLGLGTHAPTSPQGKFTYYHNYPDQYGEIEPASNLVDIDSNIQRDIQRFPEKPFCDNNPLFRGCVKISNSLKNKD